MKLDPHILVVEDDPLVGELFNELLPTHGISLDLVASAEEAVALLNTRTYALVLADKNLPGKSGIDLLEHVKTTQEDLDVIIMTAYADMRSMLTAVENGVYDYLCKPFDSLDEVIQKIQRALEKRRILIENRHLVEYLTQANAQVEAMNRELEAKVAERTRQLREVNARLEELTLTDDVTGLYNQRFLYDRLDEEFRRARRHAHGLAVMVLDLDEFKCVNDERDHLFGSQVLHEVGQILLATCRSIDMVIRYGGDEFVIILPHTHLSDAIGVAERLRAEVERRDLGDAAGSWYATLSIGVAALGSSQADSPRSLLRAADKALYEAKARGRNCVAAATGNVAQARVGGSSPK